MLPDISLHLICVHAACVRDYLAMRRRCSRRSRRPAAGSRAVLLLQALDCSLHATHTLLKAPQPYVRFAALVGCVLQVPATDLAVKAGFCHDLTQLLHLQLLVAGGVHYRCQLRLVLLHAHYEPCKLHLLLCHLLPHAPGFIPRTGCRREALAQQVCHFWRCACITHQQLHLPLQAGVGIPQPRQLCRWVRLRLLLMRLLRPPPLLSLRLPTIPATATCPLLLLLLLLRGPPELLPLLLLLQRRQRRRGALPGTRRSWLGAASCRRPMLLVL
jgi:hypothetical protein